MSNVCKNCFYEFNDFDTIICPNCQKIFCDEYNNTEEIESLKGEKDVTTK